MLQGLFGLYPAIIFCIQYCQDASVPFCLTWSFQFDFQIALPFISQAWNLLNKFYRIRYMALGFSLLVIYIYNWHGVAKHKIRPLG